MTAPVVAIGLDAADPLLVERWMDSGALPHLARLSSEGGYGRLSGRGTFRAETAWTTFLTGCDAQTTGYWTGLRFDPSSYAVEDTGAYDFLAYPPFYALGQGRRVAVFDLPQTTLVDGVDGLQVVAWGAHSPMHASCSAPAALLPELIRRHGAHPALNRDHASFWNPVAVARLRRALRLGIARRVAICSDLMAREPWDVFLTAFGETHTAGHYFWHTGDPDHPLTARKPRLPPATSTPMLETYRQVDAAVGALASRVAPESYLLVYSIHGMEANSMDLPSMVFLPELLYRLSFRGKCALGSDAAGAALGAVETSPTSLGWQRDLWGRRHSSLALPRSVRRLLPVELTQGLERLLGADVALDAPSRAGELWFQPAMWYRSHWAKMRAFALPSYSEGYVRINVAGREAGGIVEASAYGTVCDEITAQILALRNPRTGEPVARRVIRTRGSAFDGGERTPDADLVVVWRPAPADVVDSPAVGRIGPVAYGRTGSHVSRGFAMLRGPDVAAGSRLPAGRVIDLAPTILSLCGAAPNARLSGRSLLR